MKAIYLPLIAALLMVVSSPARAAEETWTLNLKVNLECAGATGGIGSKPIYQASPEVNLDWFSVPGAPINVERAYHGAFEKQIVDRVTFTMKVDLQKTRFNDGSEDHLMSLFQDNQLIYTMNAHIPEAIENADVQIVGQPIPASNGVICRPLFHL